MCNAYGFMACGTEFLLLRNYAPPFSRLHSPRGNSIIVAVLCQIGTVIVIRSPFLFGMYGGKARLRAAKTDRPLTSPEGAGIVLPGEEHITKSTGLKSKKERRNWISANR